MKTIQRHNYALYLTIIIPLITISACGGKDAELVDTAQAKNMGQTELLKNESMQADAMPAVQKTVDIETPEAKNINAPEALPQTTVAQPIIDTAERGLAMPAIPYYCHSEPGYNPYIINTAPGCNTYLPQVLGDYPFYPQYLRRWAAGYRLRDPDEIGRVGSEDDDHNNEHRHAPRHHHNNRNKHNNKDDDKHSNKDDNKSDNKDSSRDDDEDDDNDNNETDMNNHDNDHHHKYNK
jgi:hypothetical protein